MYRQRVEATVKRCLASARRTSLRSLHHYERLQDSIGKGVTYGVGGVWQRFPCNEAHEHKSMMVNDVGSLGGFCSRVDLRMRSCITKRRRKQGRHGTSWCRTWRYIADARYYGLVQESDCAGVPPYVT